MTTTRIGKRCRASQFIRASKFPQFKTKASDQTTPNTTYISHLSYHTSWHADSRRCAGTQSLHQLIANLTAQIEAQQKAAEKAKKGGNSILKKDKGMKFQCV